MPPADALMTDLFCDIAGNPRPDRAKAGYMVARDGRKLRYACFAATERPLHGTVIILAGRNECIEKYFETIRHLASRGLGAAIMDWRGQGLSDRLLRDPERGHVGRFDDYVADLDQFFSEIVLPDCRGPYYVLGHSTGALIGLLAGPLLVNRVRRMVLIAPFLAATGLPFSMRTVKRIGNVLFYLGLGSRYAYGGKRGEAVPFVTNKLTTDLDRYTRNVRLYESYPKLALGGPTVSWIRAACIASEKVQTPEFMKNLNLPILFIAAGADEVVSSKAVETYARRLKSGSLLTIDGARHEVLQEADLYREQLLAAFDAFVPGSELVAA
jgi:lysophospholipase